MSRHSSSGESEKSDHDEQERRQDELEPNTPSLPRPLRLLFATTCTSVSLQTLAIMYIINTRVAVPVPYLSTYGAISFLPWSLKPLYASLMAGYTGNRAWLIAALLTLNATCIAGTAYLPPHGVVACFVLSFIRNVFDAWAEFCLGVTLIDQARGIDKSMAIDFDIIVAKFQSQAATSRNLGSFIASVATMSILVHRKWFKEDETISYALATELLLLTASINILGALYASFNSHYLTGQATTTTHMLVPTVEVEEDLENQSTKDTAEAKKREGAEEKPSHICHLSVTDAITEDDLCDAAVAAFESLLTDLEPDDTCSNNSISSCGYVGMNIQEDQTKPKHFTTGNILLVIFLQLIVVVIAMKQPIIGMSSEFIWRSVLLSFVFIFALTGIAMLLHVPALSSVDWSAHRTGIFLILRHAMPSDSMVVSSFFYSILSSTPIMYQLISVVSMATSTLGSWSYGKFFAKYSSGAPLRHVMIGTTLLSIIVAFGMIYLVRVVHGNTGDISSWIVAGTFIAHFSSTFAEEWAFLPDIIVATSASKPDTDARTASDDEPPSDHDENDDTSTQYTDMKKESDTSALKYGTMISCIDFGDQLGAMLGGPLAAVLQVSRERGWYHLDWLMAISALANVIPLLCLWLIPTKTRVR